MARFTPVRRGVATEMSKVTANRPAVNRTDDFRAGWKRCSVSDRRLLTRGVRNVDWSPFDR